MHSLTANESIPYLVDTCTSRPAYHINIFSGSLFHLGQQQMLPNLFREDFLTAADAAGTSASTSLSLVQANHRLV